MNIHTYIALFMGTFLAAGLFLAYMDFGGISGEMKIVMGIVIIVAIVGLIFVSKDFFFY